MCGPYGHAFVSEIPVQTPDLDGNFDDVEGDGETGNPVPVAPDKNLPSDGAVGLALGDEQKKTSRSEAARKAWETRKKLYGPGGRKPRSLVLPSGQVFLPGYPALNSHHEILTRHSLSNQRRRRRAGWVPCGLHVHDGSLLLQNNRGHSTLPLADVDIKCAEQNWLTSMRGGGLWDFVAFHGGRLQDKWEWMKEFHRWLDLPFVYGQLKGRVAKDNYVKMLELQVYLDVVQGITMPGAVLYTQAHIRGDIYAELDEVCKKQDTLKVVQQKLAKSMIQLWGRDPMEAADTLVDHPNDFIGEHVLN